MPNYNNYDNKCVNEDRVFGKKKCSSSFGEKSWHVFESLAQSELADTNLALL